MCSTVVMDEKGFFLGAHNQVKVIVRHPPIEKMGVV